MNILFFLMPKHEVIYVTENDDIHTALDTLKNSGYTAIPILSTEGGYIGTITEGDFLWFLRENKNYDVEALGSMSIMDIPRRTKAKPVTVKSSMEDLTLRAMDQNFMAVIDDAKHFIGIITRRSLLEYGYSMLPKAKENEKE